MQARIFRFFASIAAFFLLAATGLYSAPPVAAEPSAPDRPLVLDIPPSAWSALWTRDEGAGSVSLDSARPGRLLLSHKGSRDWALSSGRRIGVRPGELYRLSARASISGPGGLSLEVVAYGEDGKVVSWDYGAVSPALRDSESTLQTDFCVGRGIASIEPRWSGSGQAELVLGAQRLEREPGSVPVAAPATLVLRNARIEATLSTADCALVVRDLGTGKTWRQAALGPLWIVSSALASPAPGGGGKIELELVEARSCARLSAVYGLEADSAEIEASIDCGGPMSRSLDFPQSFETEPGDRLVIPLNEGISYPVDDPAIGESTLIAYGGHGICMAFWGAEAPGGAGTMGIIETPDDAAIALRHTGGLLRVQPEWQARKGQFGYQRRLRYAFLGSGGFVAMCKRYRAYAAATGKLVTLAEKRSRNPNVDLLAGAADVWCWDREPRKIVERLRSLGMDRILWSVAESPADLAAMNAAGVLTGRYDIYQDCMDPSRFPSLRYVSPDWTSSGWPKDIVIGRDGDWVRGWGVEAKDGSLVPCGVLNDLLALTYARDRMTADLSTHPYRARFIDTTTASPWREDYSPEHPMTRTQSREAKMRLLGYASGDLGLVVGSETGHDAAVPYVHYFEGMMSLGPYRIADAGRNMRTIVDPPPPQIRTFQLGWKYRLPLWELVYHDAVIAYWYWGDYSNKMPAVWGLRDLFNCLYGTPPVYMFDSASLERDAGRFAASYRTASASARLTAYSAMENFELLSPDRSVQRSTFANGTRVTVNFGEAPWRDEEGTLLAPGSFLLRAGRADGP